ncbi:MAG TPA: Panacea domain-containing protein [Terriglobia bacterium]|nr:Panacea domain-containing protein [Terriglobia bacterium]
MEKLVGKPAENETKFKELVLYVSQKCANDPTFGATKLNKILFYTDFLAYANLGEPITAFDYQKLRWGPAPRRLIPVQNDMITKGELVLQPVHLLGGKVQKRTVNLRDPDLSVFRPQEIALIDEVIEALESARADAVSELSHRLVGWKVAEEGESIPYETIFLSDEPLTDAENERGRKLAKQFGLLAS